MLGYYNRPPLELACVLLVDGLTTTDVYYFSSGLVYVHFICHTSRHIAATHDASHAHRVCVRCIRIDRCRTGTRRLERRRRTAPRIEPRDRCEVSSEPRSFVPCISKGSDAREARDTRARTLTTPSFRACDAADHRVGCQPASHSFVTAGAALEQPRL